MGPLLTLARPKNAFLTCRKNTSIVRCASSEPLARLTIAGRGGKWIDEISCARSTSPLVVGVDTEGMQAIERPCRFAELSIPSDASMDQERFTH